MLAGLIINWRAVLSANFNGKRGGGRGEAPGRAKRRVALRIGSKTYEHGMYRWLNVVRAFGSTRVVVCAGARGACMKRAAVVAGRVVDHSSTCNLLSSRRQSSCMSDYVA